MNDLLKFMYDTMGDTARIKGCVTLLKAADANVSEAERKRLLNAIEISNNHIRCVIDQYYKENYKDNVVNK